MTDVKSLELRDERGRLLTVKDADAKIALPFEQNTIENVTTETKAVPRDIDMILAQFAIDKAGACGVEVHLNSEKQRGTCVQVFSRKRRPPVIDRYDQMKIFRTRGKERQFVFNDLDNGDVANPPLHHLGFKVVKCAKSNVSSEYVRTSPVVETSLNITFKTFVHCCTFWDQKKETWSGEGCKVRDTIHFFTPLLEF